MPKVILSLLAASLVMLGQEDEIRKAEKAWAAAVVAGDRAALDRILAGQLIYAHSTGVIETKSEYAGRLRAGKQKYEAIEHEKLEVRVYGGAAVAHAHVRMRGRSDARPFNDRLMMLHLWVRQDGRWQLAAHQTTKLE
ncbi:MAG: nuclear transport factor 2 family protein [Acidobacteriota bacterium]